MRSTRFVFISIVLHGLAVLAIALAPTHTVSDNAGQKIEVNIETPSEQAGLPEAKPVADSKPEEIKEVAEPVKAEKPVVAKARPVVKKAPAPKPVAVAVPEPSEDKAETPAPKEGDDMIAAETPPPSQEPDEKLEPVKETPPAGVEAADDGQPKAESVEGFAEAKAPDTAAPVAAAATAKKDQDTGDVNKGGASKEGAVSYLALRQMPGNKPPTYPLRARVEHRQGNLELVYRVTKAGQVADVQVAKSSGYEDFDRAAVAAIAKFRFYPGQEGWARHPVSFELKGPVTAMPSTLRGQNKQAAHSEDEEQE